MIAKHHHWSLDYDQHNILWLGFDRKGEDVNTISQEVLTELGTIIDNIKENPKITGIVIHSKKTTGFIAGADVNEFASLSDVEIARHALEKGHQVFNDLEALQVPTLALMNGFCLGGGLELALACRYRIALDDEKTRIAAPEVLLGIHPGWGGTVRLPRLVGPLSAFDLMLTGRRLRARDAKRIGLVDDIVPERQLVHAAEYYIKKQPKPIRAKWWNRLSSLKPFRKLLTWYLRREVAKKAKPEHYPAPYAMLALWQTHAAVGQEALQAEIESLVAIIHNSQTPRQLLRVFFLRERLKHFSKENPAQFQHVHVIGSGVMGGDIAAWCAINGCRVTLQDREPKFIAPAIKRAQVTCKKKLKNPRLIRDAMDRLIPDLTGEGIAHADIIIEAIYEDLSAKQETFKEIEKKARLDAILATNTSSIPLDSINQVMAEPERLVGIHFFNPVARMPLVEIVQGEKTRPDIVKQAMGFVGQIDHLPLPVKSVPGFLVNRVLMPYLMECMILLQEGVPGQNIDAACLAFGMPMGPVELADTVGLDVCLSVAKNLAEVYGGEVPHELTTLVNKGKLGRKSGQGFYRYKKGKAVKPGVKTIESPSETDIINRLISRLLNESAACLREGVVEDADLLDAGMIFGTGFAPFRGGPMETAKQIGKTVFIERFEKLQSQFGGRFKLDDYWQSTNIFSE